MNSKTLLGLFLCLCAALPARAIELSLEENKAERGNIGYIDMQKLFQTFPDTIRAKENFEELVRQAEEQLNLSKAELLRARSELSELKIEREFMAKTPIEVQRPGERKAAAIEAPTGAAAIASAAEAAARERRGEGANTENTDLQKIMEQPAPTPSAGTPAAPTAPSQPTPAPAPPAAAAPVPPSAATAPVPPSSPLAAASGAEPTAPAGRRGAEPETDLTRPGLYNLPGFGGVPASSAPVTQGAAPSQAAPAAPAAPAGPSSDENLREALEASRRAAEAKKREPLVINIPGVSTAPIVVTPPAEKPAAPAVAEQKPAAPAPLPTPAPAEVPAVSTQPAANLNPALVELDAKIAVKQKELDAKELAYKEEQASSEKNLLDLESRKTEILLGKIHRAVQEVAHREGVSVVVDKSSILYGHDAVDLTDKVMKYLRGS